MNSWVLIFCFVVVVEKVRGVYAKQKLLTFFSEKNGSVFAYNVFDNFNVSLTNKDVHFEQLGPYF